MSQTTVLGALNVIVDHSKDTAAAVQAMQQQVALVLQHMQAQSQTQRQQQQQQNNGNPNHQNVGTQQQGTQQRGTQQGTQTGYPNNNGGNNSGGNNGGNNQGQPQPQPNQPQPFRQTILDTLAGRNPATPYGGMSGRQAGAASLLGAGKEAYGIAVGISEDAARYQGMMGGTTRFDGLKELGKEKAYSTTTRLRFPNGLTGQESAQAFADVTSMGYRDDATGKGEIDRGTMLDFMQNNKTNMGMAGAESMDVANTLLKNGAVDSADALKEVSSALHEVSNAAGAAGVNALLARSNFLKMFQNMTDAGAGAGATALASAASENLTRYGRDMQDVDTSVQQQSDFQYRAAASAGISAGEFQKLMRTDPAAAQAITDKMTTGSLITTVDGQTGGKGVAWIRRRAQEAPYSGKVASDPDLLQQLAEEFANTFVLDENVLASIIKSTTGLSLTGLKIYKYIVGMILGMNASSVMGEGASATGGAANGTPGSAAGKVKSDGAGGFKTVGPGGTGGAAPAAITGMLATSGTGNTGTEAVGAGGAALSGAQSSYRDLVTKGKGTRDAHLEAVLTGLDPKAQDDTQVMIEHNGKSRIMSMADALKHFPEEVAAGQAAFISKSSGDVSTYKQVAGTEADASRDTSKNDKDKALDSVGIEVKADNPLHDRFKEAQERDAASAAGLGGDGGQEVFVNIGLDPKAIGFITATQVPATAAAAEQGVRPTPSTGGSRGARVDR